MPVSRRALLASPFALALWRYDAAAADNATATVQRFYDALVSVMKDAKRLPFDQRYQRLAPAIAEAYNLPLMSRLSIGPGWPQLPPAQQQRLSELISRYTISVYASEFDDFNGERFVIEPATEANANGTVVKTSLVKSNGEKIVLNYLMRQDGGGPWKIIDVYLNGTISQLATRRSEFVGVLQTSGADGLAKMLEDRTAALHKG